MATALFDIEANGLKPTKIHCVVVRDIAPGKKNERFRPNQIRDAAAYLSEFDTIVAHNGLVYDVPNMVRLAGLQPKKVRDSLVLSRMLFGNIKEALDDRLYARTRAHKQKRQADEAEHAAALERARQEAAEAGDDGALNENLPPPLPPDDFIGFPGNMRGRHGIEAWGMRLGLYKGDYAKKMIKLGRDPWAEFNEDMLDYCDGDVDILYKLWMDFIRPRLLGHIHPFNVDVEIVETFKQLDTRVTNKREFKIPVPIDGQLYTPKNGFALGNVIQKYLRDNPTSLPASSDPAIQSITLSNLPGYCKVDMTRPIGESSRDYIRLRNPQYIDRAVKIENEKKTAKDFDIDPASALSGQSRDRMITLTKLTGTEVFKAGHQRISAEFLNALGAIKIYSDGTAVARAVDIEHYMAAAMAELEDSGIHIDQVRLNELIADLEKHRVKFEKEILDFFPARYEPTKWVLRTYGAGPTDENTRRVCKFPVNRVLQPSHMAYVPQRCLPEGYHREYWGRIEPDPVFRRAQKRAEALGQPFVDTRDVVEEDPITNRPRVYEGDRTPIKLKPLNIKARPQIARRLMEMGWNPESFTDTGGPALDNDELEKLSKRAENPIPIADAIRLYLLVIKRIGQVLTGRQAWKKKIAADGRIHPHINPCGAVTARATHSDPNISQVPTVIRVKAPTEKDPSATRLAFGLEGEWGADCRRLFTVPNKYMITPETHPDLFTANKKGELHISPTALLAHDPSYYVVIGADLSGIELRMLAHYLAPYDGGKFREALLTGDPHEDNRRILQFANREDAKRFLFALLYGAGDEKLGSIYNPTGTIAEQKAAGRMFRDRLMAGITGFKELVADIRQQTTSGNIVALDDRHIPVRSAHSALNTLLQSGGALVSKYWIKETRARFHDALGLKYDRDFTKHNGYSMLLWSHDEMQNSGRIIHAADMAQIMIDAAAATEKILGLSIAIKAEAKIGLNWLETH